MQLNVSKIKFYRKVPKNRVLIENLTIQLEQERLHDKGQIIFNLTIRGYNRDRI